MRMLQVCNVGRIMGGTAACAWTVVRSLPEFQHTVVFLSRVAAETRVEFGDCEIEQWDKVTAERVRRSGADVVLLHNTSARRVEGPLPVATLLYQHSRITPAASDLRVFCSRWLAECCGAGAETVLHQAVPTPGGRERQFDTRALRGRPVVGRLCTPALRKWPELLVGFYVELAQRHPEVAWEFVGCPDKLQDPLRTACAGQAQFFEAAWSARERLWHWDALLYHHPTLTESFGRTAAEALRAGCIPIVDRRGGFQEQLVEGCGHLCTGIEEFSSAIATLSDPGEKLRQSRRCRAHGDREFSLQQFRDELFTRLRALAVGETVY
ncbi:hypothetical protein Mal52_10540 [Symmachiella dynata]|uniref:Glycosyl transferases group 1 n=2 Tax=Symmachiella dynata TaxID=2527995 RepID=A0A517ZJE0_9PLAN|nr:hypothetical protein Mal52_10540 [Symmachiella dynata]